jgi:hypothetical protein
MTPHPYRHPVADEQTWVQALLENEMRSVVEVREIAGGRSEVGLNAQGDVVYVGCGRRRDPDPVYVAQDAIETGSQVVGADDEWA